MHVTARDVKIRITRFHMAADATGADGHHRRNLIFKRIGAHSQDYGKFSVSVRAIEITVELGAVRGRN